MKYQRNSNLGRDKGLSYSLIDFLSIISRLAAESSMNVHLTVKFAQCN